MRRQDLKLEHWWEVYQDQASLIIDKGSFVKLLGAKGQWSHVAAELECVVNGSKMGHRAFGHANTYVVGAEMKNMVNECLLTIADKATITKADIDKIQDKLMARAANKSAASALAMKRDVLCNFRNLEITIQVANFQEVCIQYHKTNHIMLCKMVCCVARQSTHV